MKETYAAYQFSEFNPVPCSARSSSSLRRGEPDSSIALNYSELEMMNSGKLIRYAYTLNMPRMEVHPPEWSQPTPVIPTTTNTFDRRLLNTAIDWAAPAPETVQRATGTNKEAIHSGHFMVSDLKEEDDEQDDQIEKIAPDITKNVENEVIRKRSVGVNNVLPQHCNEHIASMNAGTSSGSRTSKISTDELRRRFIEASLTQLFQCMSLAYSAKLTSPKWNNFKGLKIRWAIKIRLNNYIWRAWHMQFVKRNVQQFSPFALETESMHNRPEAVVLEGKYWKRRLSMAAAEYRKVRLFFKSWANKKSLYQLLPQDLSTDIDMGLGLPDDFDMSLLQFEPMLTDEGGMLFGEDFIQTITSGQHQMIFPNAREIAQQAGIADFIQPGLLELQPSVSEYVDSNMFADSFQAAWGTAGPFPGNSSNFNAGGMHASSSSSSMRNADSGGWQPIQQQQPQQMTGNNYLSPQQQTGYESGLLTEPSRIYEPGADRICQQQNCMVGSDKIQKDTGNYVVLPPPPYYQQQQLQPNINSGGISVFARPQQPKDVGRNQSTKLPNSRTVAPPTMPMQVDDGCFGASAGQFRPRSISGPRPAMQQQQLQQQNYPHQQHFNASPSTNRSVTFEQPQQQQSSSSMNQPYFVKPVPSGVPIVNTRRPTDASLATIQQHRLSLPDDNLSPFADQLECNERPQRTKSDVTEISGYIQQHKLHMGSNASYFGSDPVFKPPVPPPLPAPTTPIQHTHGAIYAALLANNNNNSAVTRGGTVAEPDAASADDSSRSKPKRRSTKTTAQREPSSRKISAPSSNLGVSGPLTPSAAGKSKSTAAKSVSNAVTVVPPKIFTPPTLKHSFSTPDGQGVQHKTLPPPFQSSPAASSSLLSAQQPSTTSISASSSSLAIFSSSAASTSSCSTATTMPSAEQMRRTHIKSGFDVLLNLLPSNYKQQQQQQQQSSPQGSSSSAAAAAAAAAAKVSKAAVLHKSADYIKHLKTDRKRMQDEEDNLHKRIVQLNEEINYYHTQLPETGVPTVASRQRGEQMRTMFDGYIRQRTLENHKFYAFGLIMRRLFDSYCECVTNVGGNGGSNSSGSNNKQDAADEFGEIVMQWHEQHCTLPQLRPIVRDSLRQLCTSTSIMSSPETYAQSVRDKAILLSGARNNPGTSGRASARRNAENSANS